MIYSNEAGSAILTSCRPAGLLQGSFMIPMMSSEKTLFKKSLVHDLILETSVLRTDTGKRGKKAWIPKLTFLTFDEQHWQQEPPAAAQLSWMLCNAHTHF